MSEVSTSRRGVMRALTVLPSIFATTAIANAATGLACIPTASQDPSWLALIDQERQTSLAYNVALEAEDQAYDRYFAAKEAADAKWQAEWDGKAGKPHIFIDARPAHEAGDLRVNNGIVDHNAFCSRMQAKRKTLEASCDQESGFPAAKENCLAAGERHDAAIRAVIAYPSRDPDIIAHKLRLLIGEYGDEESRLASLLASIGEA